jgi:hypothetical protein
MKFLNDLMEAIKRSSKDHLGKESSARISSYFVLAFIILNSLAFMVIEIVNAAVKWNAGETYTIPTEHIWIFGLILSHHLGLLFYKSREYKGKNEFVNQSNLEDIQNSVKPGNNSNDFPKGEPVEEYPTEGYPMAEDAGGFPEEYPDGYNMDDEEEG